jgi:hypothetical protein
VGEDLGFGGEVAGFYHKYRRGYPPAVIDTLTGAFRLTCGFAGAGGGSGGSAGGR